jgi:hypothetical protein
MPFSHHRTSPCVLDDDVMSRLAHDPWALSPTERGELARAQTAAQLHWLPRLRQLVEPPLPADTFPAFLLETPPFARLRRAIGESRQLTELDVGTADELQRFVDCYRDYLV